MPMSRAFDARRVLSVTDVARARLFVVRDVVSLPRLVSCAAPLVGGPFVSTTLCANPPGPCIVFDRALHLECWVWISRTCAGAAPATIDLLQQRVARAKSESQGARWHLISRAEFSKRAAWTRNQCRRSSELVAVVTAGEMAMWSCQRTNDVTHNR